MDGPDGDGSPRPQDGRGAAAAADATEAGSDPDPDPDPARWQALAADALARLGAPDGVEVDLRFVDEAEMAALNAEHLGGSGPTDVLSFPLDLADGIDGDLGPPPHLAGDIVICLPVAARNAPEHAGSLDDELALLVVHSVLHLVGHDHADDDERVEMQAHERALLAALHGPLARDPWTSAGSAP
jgi:probable rRNA maturation factor